MRESAAARKAREQRERRNAQRRKPAKAAAPVGEAIPDDIASVLGVGVKHIAGRPVPIAIREKLLERLASAIPDILAQVIAEEQKRHAAGLGAVDLGAQVDRTAGDTATDVKERPAMADLLRSSRQRLFHLNDRLEALADRLSPALQTPATTVRPPPAEPQPNPSYVRLGIDIEDGINAAHGILARIEKSA